jgi:hypothetical protein
LTSSNCDAGATATSHPAANRVHGRSCGVLHNN